MVNFPPIVALLSLKERPAARAIRAVVALSAKKELEPHGRAALGSANVQTAGGAVDHEATATAAGLHRIVIDNQIAMLNTVGQVFVNIPSLLEQLVFPLALPPAEWVAQAYGLMPSLSRVPGYNVPAETRGLQCHHGEWAPTQRVV
jgi:hypothetical protein